MALERECLVGVSCTSRIGILEVNPSTGVTQLTYQKIKSIFSPQYYKSYYAPEPVRPLMKLENIPKATENSYA